MSLVDREVTTAAEYDMDHCIDCGAKLVPCRCTPDCTGSNCYEPNGYCAPRLELPAPIITDHEYLSAGDTAAASGDRAYVGCVTCGRPRKEHAK